MQVRTVLADRGYGHEAGDQALAACGVRDAVIPRVGRAAPVEATRAWRRRIASGPAAKDASAA
jgi:hypothetical protein